MVVGTGVYGPVGSVFHELLWSLPIMVVHHTTRELRTAPYNGISFWSVNYRDKSGWHTWKNVASETT